MGQAKNKMRCLERKRQQQPFCVYCEGTTPIETIEHIPPISMFDHSFRPEGLEFGACYSCNHNSRLDDMALAVVSRCFPDPVGNALMEEARRHIVALHNNWLELSLEMLSSPGQVQIARTTEGVAGALNARGPLLNGAMERVGLRLGLALHCDQTGLIVPRAGGVLVRWYTNCQERIGRFPEDLLRPLGPLQTLRQGKRTAEGQFEFSSLSMADGGMSAHLSRFRQAFVIVSLVTMDRGLLPDMGIAPLMLPGALREARNNRFQARPPARPGRAVSNSLVPSP
jgi:hypothetical protein